MIVVRISAITIKVDDMAKSVHFYSRLLGLKVLYGGESAYFSSLQTLGTKEILFATGVLTMADINEVVVRGSAAGFAQEILAGRHPLTADEPVAAGGADTGPTPYDLLLAALGA
jgi:catechol 2,3-dioxygenase-like lactoylglutathione lyase family enzyme